MQGRLLHHKLRVSFDLLHSAADSSCRALTSWDDAEIKTRARSAHCSPAGLAGLKTLAMALLFR